MGILGLFQRPEAEDLYDDYDYEEAYDDYEEPEPEPVRPMMENPGVQPIHTVAELRDMKFVVLNLADTDPEVARRLLDFVSGVIYSEDGHIMKIATNVYVVAPYFVDLLGDSNESETLYYGT